MKNKAYSELRKEFGKSLWQMANLCAAATIFKGIEGINLQLMGIGFAIIVMLYIIGMALIHSASEEE